MEPDPASLSNLHDIVAPEPVSAWPPAAGWWVVITLAVAWLAILVAHLAARHHRNAYRRAGLTELARFKAGGGGLTELSVLLKRVALAAWPREDVASLTGDAWLQFLDSTGGTKDFTSGAGSALGKAATMENAIPEESLPSLLACCRRWVAEHVSPPPAERLARSGHGPK